MPDFKHWVEYGKSLEKRAANAASSSAKKRRQIDALAAKASSFFSLGERFSQRGFCACAQILTGLLLSMPGTSVQPLHKGWCV